ncbi:DUF2087 domain-containing protein [Actinospica sp. MGRD01-02]|uniref:DUF2087 domain-containing protein n=1 Tax=Actinospica acidithermotolerans TaxID=2828514 RepID=A0A941IGE2_9ACTN|nr:DUF2087 domain-containing protein [Actinospica acidithermotolerans]MBR7826034.1 DUF2087 domain-containing protein [Actinospica acidithermotolerans]
MEDNDQRVPDPRQLVAVLADTAKLRVFAALVLADPPEGLTAAQLAAAAGADAAETGRALANLGALGLVRGTRGDRYTAAPEVFRRALSELNRQRDEAAAKAFSTTDPARLSVLLNCFQDGKLVYLPEKFGKRQIVLEEVAQAFEPGTRYAEAEVNMVLRDLYPDYAALRRYLIDSAFLSREDGFYWRTGGTVDV